MLIEAINIGMGVYFMLASIRNIARSWSFRTFATRSNLTAARNALSIYGYSCMELLFGIYYLTHFTMKPGSTGYVVNGVVIVLCIVHCRTVYQSFYRQEPTNILEAEVGVAVPITSSIRVTLYADGLMACMAAVMMFN